MDPEAAVFQAMLDGWGRQQRARFLQESGTIAPRLALVRRLADCANLYPWQWTPVEAEAFISHLRSGTRPIIVSAAHGYEILIQMFCAFVGDPRYGWPEERERRFGMVPQQVLHEWNTVPHVAEHEGNPRSRPLHYDEVQTFSMRWTAGWSRFGRAG
ncbi:hypothetical protein [Streptomyces sp. NPDC060035]|uniref:hypothetical protein n=1 Tax=Streptomyces sp. NPDC060035 TaxID=3347044 RepID=UPI0036BE637A